LSRSQIFSLLSAKVSVDEIVLEEVKPKKAKKETDEAESETKSEAESESEAEAGSESQETEEETEKEKEPEAEATESGSESEGESTDADAGEEEAPKEYKEVVVPHSFTIDYDTKYHGVRRLSEEAMKAAGKRIKALEKRDENKKLTDEAKNGYESLIYEMREWLGEDENEPYLTEDARDELRERLSQAEDWLYDEGADLGYKEYQNRQYDLQKEFTKFRTYKKEHMGRVNLLPKMLEELAGLKVKVDEIRESMPWVTEEEQDDLSSKANDVITFIEENLAKQEAEGSLSEEPLFTVDEVLQKMKKLESFGKKIFGKKKPKEKKEKKKKEEKQDTEEGEDKSEDKAEAEADQKREESEETRQEETQEQREPEPETETETKSETGAETGSDEL